MDARRRSAACTVLVVDDEDVLQRLMRRMLERAGHRVLEAGSASEAIELAGLADVVVADRHMPGMRGDELCALLRERLGIRTVIVSGDGSDTADADVFLRKPFTTAELLEAVDVARRLRGLSYHYAA